MKKLRSFSAYVLPILILLSLPTLLAIRLPYNDNINFIIGMLISYIVSIILGFLIESIDKKKVVELLSIILSLIGMFSFYGLVQDNEKLLIIGLIGIGALSIIVYIILNTIINQTNKRTWTYIIELIQQNHFLSGGTHSGICLCQRNLPR